MRIVVGCTYSVSYTHLSIPIAIPGISTPVKLGLAGGPIVVGILIGCFGPRFHLITYTTRSANPVSYTHLDVYKRQGELPSLS